MKYSHPYFIAGIVLLLVIGPIYVASGQTVPIANHIVINEVDLNPSGDYTKSPVQWVELYNPTNSPVSIGGWSIGATSGLKQSYTISLGTTIQPQQFILYHYVPLWFPTVGASIQLKGSDGTVIDQTPALTDTQGDGNTWQRLYDGYNTGSQNDWVYKTGTPGFSNGSPPVTSTSSQLTLSVSTDKQGYIFGDFVNISGQVSQIVKNPAVTSIPTTVNIVMSGPNGFKQTFSLYPGTDLKFSTFSKTDQVLGFSAGMYTISATYGSAQASTTFLLDSAAFVPPPQVAATTLTISTTNSNYTVSQPIVLQGIVSQVIPLTPVQFKVYDPTNTVVYQGTMFPDSQGKLTTANQYQSSAGSSGLLINNVNPVYGIYRVAATYGSASTFTTFTLIPAQVQNQMIMMSTDKKAYAPGETVIIRGSVLLQGQQNLGLNPSLQIIQTTVGGSSGTQTTGNRGITTNTINTVTLLNVQTDNTFTYKFTIPGTSASLGNYRTIVSAQKGIAEADFVVMQDPSQYKPATSSSPFTIVTDKSSYSIGDTIFISGQILNPVSLSTQNAGANVKIQVLNSTGGLVTSGGSFINNLGVSTSNALSYFAFPDANGNFQVSQILQRGIYFPGTYTLKATYVNNLSASTTFVISDALANISQTSVVASTDKKIYGIGDLVQLNGKISALAGTDSYTLTLVKPSGSQITLPLKVNNGQFSWTWTIPATDTAGSVMTSTDRSTSTVLDPTLSVYGIYRIKITSTQGTSDIFFQVSKTPQASQDLSPIVVQTDKTSYLSTDVARIWGQILPTQNAATQTTNPTVQVLIYSNNGQQVYRGDANVNQGGQFYVTVPFHVGIWQSGTYKLYADYLTNKAIISFKITDPYTTTSSSKLQLYITTDTDKYLPGQTVLITGRTSNIVSVDKVDLAFGLKNDTVISEGEVISKKGNVIPKATTSFDQYGSFSYDYKIPNNAKLGSYTIIAQVPFGSFNAYFDVVNQIPIESTPFTNETQIVSSNATQTSSMQTTIPITVGPTQKPSVSANTFVEKINQVSDSTIPIVLSQQSRGNMTYYPRQIDALLRVNPNDVNDVSIKLSSHNGTCIIGQDFDCLVKKSTVQSGNLYQTVSIDGKNYLVGYLGAGLRLQQFSILPEGVNDVMPNDQWTVDVIKKDQPTRFYFQVTYVGK